MKKFSYLLLMMFVCELKTVSFFNNLCRRRGGRDTNPVAVNYRERDFERGQDQDENPVAPVAPVFMPGPAYFRITRSFDQEPTRRGLDQEIEGYKRMGAIIFGAALVIWGTCEACTMISNSLSD